MTKCALWLRVSDPEQSIDNQRPALMELAERRDLEVVKVYEIQESAWKTTHQRLLADLYEAARLRQFDYLLVWALDRLSREGALATLEIYHRLTKGGITVVSLQEPWVESSGELRDVLLAFTGWAAHMESKRKSERVKAGMKREANKGRNMGRPVVQTLVNTELVNRLRSEGASWPEIHKAHPATVKTPKGGYKRPSQASIRRVWKGCQKVDGENSSNGHHGR